MHVCVNGCMCMRALCKCVCTGYVCVHVCVHVHVHVYMPCMDVSYMCGMCICVSIYSSEIFTVRYLTRNTQNNDDHSP